MHILLFEDHCRLADSITEGLAPHGFGVDAFPTGADGLCAFKSTRYDAVLLDLGLPDRDGFDVLSELRQGGTSTPILIVTARDGIGDRVTGLDHGADDYVVKPFAIVELAARLRALLRRPGQALGAVLSVGNLQLDVGMRHVTVKGSTLRLSTREIQALELLMRREGQVIPKSVFENDLYGLTLKGSPNSVEVLISRLRHRLNSVDTGCSIHTLHGIGYMLKGDVD